MHPPPADDLAASAGRRICIDATPAGASRPGEGGGDPPEPASPALGGPTLCGQGWVGKERDERRPFRLDDGYYLMPYFRPEAIDVRGTTVLASGR